MFLQFLCLIWTEKHSSERVKSFPFTLIFSQKTEYQELPPVLFLTFVTVCSCASCVCLRLSSLLATTFSRCSTYRKQFQKNIWKKMFLCHFQAPPPTTDYHHHRRRHHHHHHCHCQYHIIFASVPSAVKADVMNCHVFVSSIHLFLFCLMLTKTHKMETQLSTS